MTRYLRSACAVAGLTAVVVLVSCSDGATPAPTAPGQRVMDLQVQGCLSIEEIERLARRAFGRRRGVAEAIEDKAEKVVRFAARRDMVKAKQAAFDAVKFVLLQAGKSRFGGSTSDVDALIKGIFCLAGISLPDPSSSSSGFALIYPTDAPQIVTTGDGLAGVSLPGNPVTEPTLLTITVITGSFVPGGGPLNTKLDQYPGYYEFKKQSATDPPLTQPVVVAVCPTGSMTPEVRARLRLGHNASAGFEVTPPADASFLSCPSLTALNSSGPAWMRTIASLVLPRALLASGVRLITGGVGGSAGEFSPFGPVDPLLSATGGVGGSAGEFLVAPVGAGNPLAPSSGGPASASSSRKAVTSPTMLQQLATRALAGAPFLANATISSCSVAIVGAALAPECRPLITITTRLGTPFENVPVSWAVVSGGGAIAPESGATLACGAFGATASNSTGARGKAGVCWTMGASAGANAVVATPGIGGDAVAGVTFSPASQTFTVTTALITPIAGATGGVFTYDGTAHPGSGSCSDGLTPALTYSGGAAPVVPGDYSVTVTCGAGNPLFVTVTASAPISIALREATATAGSATVTFGTLVSSIPCAMTGLIAADVGSITCATTSAAVLTTGSYPTAPSVSPASPANYLVTSVNGIVTFTPYVQSGCFAAPLSATQPSSSVFLVRGSMVTLACTLTNSLGAPVAGAKGDVMIENMDAFGSVSAAASPVAVFSGTDVFVGSAGVYSYTLDTSLAGYDHGHAFRVTTTWSDGSTTVGWFNLR